MYLQVFQFYRSKNARKLKLKVPSERTPFTPPVELISSKSINVRFLANFQGMDPNPDPGGRPFGSALRHLNLPNS